LTDQQDDEGGVAGTPAYMAPEQAVGRTVTERSDLYSLGLVLYEVFTGRRPFDAKTPADLERLREDSAPSAPSDIPADLDPAVERVILQCLEKEPSERPPSALAQVRQPLACYPGFFGVGGRKSSLHLLSTYDLPGQVQGQAFEQDRLVIGRTTDAAAANLHAVAGR
jgi:serine/threonine protein kinase